MLYANDINSAYQEVFGRDADASGLETYGGMLDSGTISVGDLPTILKSSDEYTRETGLHLVDSTAAMRGGQGASGVLGELHRAQWDDWKSRFAPKIDQLVGMAGDKALPGQAAHQAMQSAGNRFSGARTALAMNQKRLGLQLSGDQVASQDRKFALSEAASMTNAANKARASTLDMQQSIIAGNMGSQSLPISMASK